MERRGWLRFIVRIIESEYFKRWLHPSLWDLDPLAMARAKLLAVSSLIMFLLGPAVAQPYFSKGEYVFAAMTMGFACLGFGSHLALRWRGSIWLAVNILCLAFYGATFTGIPALGGTESPATPWVGIVPAFAILFGGVRLGTIWIGVSIATLLFFTTLELQGVRWIGVFVGAEMLTFNATNTLTLLFTLWVLFATSDGLREWLVEQVKRDEETVREARDEAMAASQAKSRFMANMSHELRTPLSTIIGYTDMIFEELEFEKEEEFVYSMELASIRDAAHNLLEIVTGILDLTSIETGKISPSPEEFLLQRVLDDLYTPIHFLASEHKNELVFEVASEFEEEALYTDAHMLKQMLFHLLANATKFTVQGQVVLSISSPSEDRVCFEVRDTGSGISPEALSKIWETFAQQDESTTRRFGGMGLGLALVRHFVSLLGGEIQVESVLGEGSTFRVNLPRKMEVISQ